MEVGKEPLCGKAYAMNDGNASKIWSKWQDWSECSNAVAEIGKGRRAVADGDDYNGRLSPDPPHT